MECPFPQAARNHASPKAVQPMDHRIDPRVQPVNPLEGTVEDVGRRHLALPDQVG